MPNAGLSRDPDGLEFVDPDPGRRGIRMEWSIAGRQGKVVCSRLIASDSRQRQPQAEEIDRFREMHVEAGIAAAFLVGGGEVSADGNGGDLGVPAPDLGDEIVTILVGQTDIAQDHVHFILLKKLEAARGGIACRDVMSPAAEDRRKSALGIWMILDE